MVEFKCPMCGGSFQSKQELDSHAQKMHGSQASGQEYSIACSKCGLKTNAIDKMEAHSCQTC